MRAVLIRKDLNESETKNWKQQKIQIKEKPADAYPVLISGHIILVKTDAYIVMQISVKIQLINRWCYMILTARYCLGTRIKKMMLLKKEKKWRALNKRS